MPNSYSEKYQTMPTPKNSSLRIYYLYPQFAGPARELENHLDRCAAMGFSEVMMPAAIDPAADATAKSIDQAALTDAIQPLVAACGQRQLALFLDLDITTVDARMLQVGADSTAAIPENSDEPPDPRKRFPSKNKTSLDLTRPEIAAALLNYWQNRLRQWIDAGVSGFCCKNFNEVPPSFWQTLIASAKQLRAGVSFLAWTPGCTLEQLAALSQCGFDATFSSAAWWNYKAGWLAEEHVRLLRIAPPIAFPDSPFAPVIYRLDDRADDEASYRAHQRALRLAAATGNGILIPMGFEFGLSGALDLINGTPTDFAKARDRATFDLSDEIAGMNAAIAQFARTFATDESGLSSLTMSESNVAALLRHPVSEHDPSREALLVLANAVLSSESEVDVARLRDRARGYVQYERIWPPGVGTEASAHLITLRPGEVQVFHARRMTPITAAPARGKRAVEAAARTPRIAIEAISPAVDAGRFPVKRTVGDLVAVEADAFIDGHDKLGVALLWRTADEAEWQEVRMQLLGNDRWSALLPLSRIGRHLVVVEAWRDAFATYRDELEKKVKAGLDVSLELEEGRLLVSAAAEHAATKGLNDIAAELKQLAGMLQNGKGRRARKSGSTTGSTAGTTDAEYSARITAMLSAATVEAMRQADARAFAVRSDPVITIDAERTAARFSSWYELFPRSQSGDPARHGTFADVEKRLPAIREMGFDTLYFPPIHPIGKKNRKGRNNSLTPTENDPGSPYAIGSPDGGHDAIHPELGTIEDFRHLRDEAAKHGLELALDFAIQCSPDHPWLKQHPDWFDWRPDGSIRYAENPPKKYEDIVNVDFYAEGAIPGLWIALRDAVLFWVKEGVRVFRVDNPHTKPLPFWQWMIGDIRARFPDTIFLSEAFTRPKMMYRLAKVGFSQSYTYFTWRHTKAEFTDYLTELTTTSVKDYFRPHFFVNTPDINPVFLQQSGRPGFLIRAALATTLSGLWGMYSGFELCEATPVPGKEDYLDSEKYEIRAWDWQRPGNIIQEISVLNRIRMANPALQTHLGIRFYPSSSDNILYFIKATPHPTQPERFGDNVVLVAINLDPFVAHDSSLELPLWQFGLPDDGTLEADDLVRGNRFVLRGKMHQIRLDPFDTPYAIWRLRPQGS